MTGKKSNIRTRFAPSPTGFVHIGSLRTALFSFLFARKKGGKHILRIEDTDQSRKIEGTTENLLKVMKELGVEFDEGVFLNEDDSFSEKGKFGPYMQSERLDIYKQHASKLVEQGSAYYCFCDEKRLEELKKEQIALKKPAMYDGCCRKLSKEETRQKLEDFSKQGKNPVIRQAIPHEGQTLVHDLIYGDIIFEHKILDDQILLKSDNFPTYHLAVVVDDHLMQITHVIRGEEWISSTPKHLLLYKAFGWEPTQFAHLPLILNPDKTKLSKRQGDVAVEEFLNKGYLKEALVNFVAFLGWNPKTQQEIFSLNDLIHEFDLAKINKASAIFDTCKLDWMNSLYIRSKPIKELTDLIIPYWKKIGIDTDKYNRTFLEAIVELRRPRIKTLSEIGERTGYFFTSPEYEAELLIWKKSDNGDAKQKLQEILELYKSFQDEDFSVQKLEEKTKAFIEAKNYQNGNVLWPLRVALSGQKQSPSPFEIASVLFLGPEKEEILKRIKTAISKL